MSLDIFDGAKKTMRIVLSLVMLLATTMAYPMPITYVHTGFGAGTLDGAAFGTATPLAFTITAVGDTANVVSCPPAFGASCLFNDNTTASITINSIGTFDFISVTSYFSNLGIVGFAHGGASHLDLFNGPAVPTWDMLSSIGPIDGTGELLDWGTIPVLTSGGVLYFNDGSSVSTFMASTTPAPIPEPSAWLLIGSGCVGLLGYGWRRRRYAWRPEIRSADSD